jgi:hypothetical protein
MLPDIYDTSDTQTRLNLSQTHTKNLQSTRNMDIQSAVPNA